MVKMSLVCKLTHYCNKGKSSYFPYETGTIDGTVENSGDVRYHIYGVVVKFGWQEEGKSWVRNCSIELEPGEKEKLPPVEFRIPVDVKLGSHTYRFGLFQEALNGSKWVDHGERLGSKTFHILVEKAPSRGFRVFISHSNHKDDELLVETAQKLLEACGIDAYVAEKKGKPGVRLWSKLERENRKADAMLVLWTEHGATSGDVREEIGIAVGVRKYEKIVPITEVDLHGSLKGKEYAPLNRETPEKAVVQAIESILEMAAKKRPAPSREVKTT